MAHLIVVCSPLERIIVLWGSLAAKFDMRLNTQSDGIWYALTR